MNRIMELILNMCPNGVEYKATKDVCIDKFWLMPATPNYVDSGIRYITSKNIKNREIDFSTASFITEEDYQEISKNRSIQVGDFLITMIGTIGETAIVTDNCLFYGQNIYLLRLNTDIVLVKFYQYCFENGRELLNNKKNNSSQGYLKAGSIDDFVIPVPPIEVQKEIVEVLDKFLNLNIKLTMELTLRRRQFEAYMSVFFDMKERDDVDWIPLSEVATVTKGETQISKAIEGDYPLVVTTSERKSHNSFQFDSQAVCIPLVSSRGHGVASLNHVYYQEGKFALGSILCGVVPKDRNKLCAKFLYYYFEYTKDYTLVPLMKGGANVALHKNDIEKIKVPVPKSIELQKSIVYMLEKFDTICNDTVKGLPAEIEARHKQYEYYRDKLLTFERKVV